MAVKVDIISGFLGAGKTTFIKKLMKDLYSDANVVILENEFGKINIDEGTLQRDRIQVKSIQAGCICCSSSFSLIKGLREILSEYQPDRIIIEPTGIARLSEIKRLLMNDSSDQAYSIDHIITIVDAKNYQLRTLISKSFFEDQIRASELLFLSKTSLLNASERNHVKDEIHKLQPACVIVDEVWDDIAPVRLLELLRYQQISIERKHKLSLRQNPVNDYESYELILEGYLAAHQLSLFAEDIASGLYGEIHRVKGLCCDPGSGWYQVDYVPGELITKALGSSQITAKSSILCIIGRQLNLPLLRTFSSFIRTADTASVSFSSPF